MEITPLWLAERYGTVREFAGADHHPAIQWWHLNAGLGRHQADETSWCGSYVHNIAWELDLDRPSLPARARSWLTVGEPIALDDLTPGFDVVILCRGVGPQPGADVIDAPGHVGFFVKLDAMSVWLCGGNQGDKVSVAPFPQERFLGGRRLRRVS